MIPARGWYVEIDHPTTGRVITPAVLDGASRNPQLNDYPRIQIRVEDKPLWHTSALEDNRAPMRVWKDGKRQPIDELARIETGSDGVVTLIGRGGSELTTRVTEDFDSIDSHKAAEQIITTYTSYTANVDTPNVDTDKDVELQAADTTSEFQNVDALDDTDPFVADSGRFKLAQSLFLGQAEDVSYSGASFFETTGNVSSDNFDTKGEGRYLTTNGDSVSVTFTTDYTWPAADAAAAVRLGNPNTVISDGHPIEIQLDGEVVFSTVSGFSLSNNWSWFDGFGVSADLSPGDHTVKIVIPSGETLGSDDVYVDLLAGYDSRYSYTFDNQVNSDYALDGPELYPDAATALFQNATTFQKIVALNFDSVWDDVSGPQKLEFSLDGGSNYPISASNTQTLDQDVAESNQSSRIRLRATMGRYGSRSTGTTPTQGFNGQSMDSYSLKCDLINIPRLVNRRVDGRAMQVLRNIADEGNFVFEVQWDDAAGEFTVEWAQERQRTGDEIEDVIQYEQTVSPEDIVRKATVKGSAKPVRAESFTADHGTAVDLQQSELVPASTVVYDPDTETQFEEDVDYEVAEGSGTITTLSDGDMINGDTYHVDYRWRPTGTVTSSKAGSDPPEVVRDITGLTTADQCKQVASQIIDANEDGQISARVTIPDQAVGFELINAASVAPLPTDISLLKSTIENTPDQTNIEMETQSVSEIVSDINQRVQSIAERS